MSEAADVMVQYRCHKIVRAGEIGEVSDAGCYVLAADGKYSLRFFRPGMTARYQPREGDFWVVYAPDANGAVYEAISPRDVFLEGYTAMSGTNHPDDDVPAPHPDKPPAAPVREEEAEPAPTEPNGEATEEAGHG